MKNIHDILSGIGITVPEDKKAEFGKALNENYKTVAEVQQKDAKIQSLSDQLKTAQDGLKAFEGIDVKDLQGKIEKLQQDIKDKDKGYETKLAEAEFNRNLESAISAAKGRNAKAITAMLDVSALKASKNQSEDIKKALEDVKKEHSYLFEGKGQEGQYSEHSGGSEMGGKDGKYDPEVLAFAKGMGIDLNNKEDK